MRRRGGFRTCRGQRERFVEAKRAVLLPRLELAVSRLILPHLAASLRFQTCRKRKDHSLKKFSALRPARQDTGCAFSTTPVSKNSPQASKTLALLGVPGGGSRASQEASETAPRGQGLQEASKSPPRRPRCVCYCVLQSKLASGLKNLRFSMVLGLPRGRRCVSYCVLQIKLASCLKT